jgi:hypothetical protein
MKRSIKVKGQTGQPGTEGMFEKWGMMGGGRGGRSSGTSTLQSNRSGPNLAGNRRRAVMREDLVPDSGYQGKGTGTKVDRVFLQKQQKRDVASQKRVKKKKDKEEISGRAKRAKRDKELEGKIGKKGLKEAQKAHKGLYGDWDIGGA